MVQPTIDRFGALRCAVTRPTGITNLRGWKTNQPQSKVMEKKVMSLLQKISSCCAIASFLMNFFQVNVNTIQQSIAPKRDRLAVEIVWERYLDRQD